MGIALIIAGAVFLFVAFHAGTSFISGNKPGRDELMFLIGGVAAIVSGVLIGIYRPMK